MWTMVLDAAEVAAEIISAVILACVAGACVFALIYLIWGTTQ